MANNRTKRWAVKEEREGVENVTRNFRDPTRKEMNPLNVLHFQLAESISHLNEESPFKNCAFP